MEDEEYEMDGGYEEEPMEPELDEGAEEEVDPDANKDDDIPDPLLGDGEERQGEEQVTKYEHARILGIRALQISMHPLPHQLALRSRSSSGPISGGVAPPPPCRTGASLSVECGITPPGSLEAEEAISQLRSLNDKLKEEIFLLKAQNEELCSKLRRSENVISRVKEELVNFRATSGRNPCIHMVEEQRLKDKLKKTEEERLRLAQELSGLCTTISSTVGTTTEP